MRRIIRSASSCASGAISVAASGESDVRVYGGQVQATTKAGDTIQLTENEGVKIDQSGKAGPELKLPGVDSPPEVGWDVGYW